MLHNSQYVFTFIILKKSVWINPKRNMIFIYVSTKIHARSLSKLVRTTIAELAQKANYSIVNFPMLLFKF